jgi:hypothetical protein
MRKQIRAGLVALALLGGFAVASDTPAAAGQPPTVHHPDCDGLVKDIPPGAPTPVDGIVWVKAGPEHVNVGAQFAGYIAPSPNGHDVSHVDVCPKPPVTPPPCEHNPELPADHPDCKPPVTPPPCVHNPELPAGHPDCKPPVTPPPCVHTPELPAGHPDCKPPVTPPSVPPVNPPPVNPPPVNPPPVNPPPVNPSVPEVASRPPVPSTPEAVAPSSPQAAAPTAANPTAALPATGLDSTGVTALLALLITGLGGLAVMVARRRNATS